MISNLLIQEKTLDEAWQDWYDIITNNISEERIERFSLFYLSS